MENRICRSCLKEFQEGSELRSIFKIGKIGGEITTLSYMITWFTGLRLLEGDGLPEHICTKCVLSVSRSYAFKQLCLQSDKSLQERLKSINKESKATQANTKNECDDDEEEKEPEYIDVIYKSDDPENELVEQQPTNEKITFIQIKYEDKPSMNMETFLVENIDMENERQEESSSLDIRIIQDIPLANETEGNLKMPEDTDSLEKNSEIISADEDIIPKMVFKRHRKRAKEIPKPPYKCDVCSKVLSNYASYKYHIQLHSDDTPFLCSDCGLGFKTRNAYDGHRITHSENNPNTCNICGKSYRQAASLRSHMLVHSGERPFLCGICGKGMTQKSGFKKHMLIHTGERPYQCDICQKHFRYSSNLITHKRSHLGEKPYHCKVCDKSFVGSEHLKRHSMIHTGQKPFSCEHCGKCFNRKCSLQIHKLIHTGKKLNLKVPNRKVKKENDITATV